MSEISKDPEIKQPTEEQQREYISARDNDATVVRIEGTNKKYKIRWLRNGQMVKLSRLLLHKADTDDQDPKDGDKSDILREVLSDNKLACKAAAIFILNSWVKLKLCYWFLWRWFYYVKEYSDAQLHELLNEGKKKVPWVQFLGTTMCLTEAKGTLMNMTMREAEHTLQELRSAQDSQTGKDSNGSTQADTSSSDS